MSTFLPDTLKTSNSNSPNTITSLLNRPPLKCVAYQAGNLEGFENSLSALQQSSKTGAFGAELTIRKTMDNVFVAVKDENLKRLTGQNKNISELDYEDISPFVNLIENDFGESFKQENLKKEKPAKLSEIFSFLKENSMVLFLDLQQLEEGDVFKVLMDVQKRGLINRIIPIVSVWPRAMEEQYWKSSTKIFTPRANYPLLRDKKDSEIIIEVFFALNFFKGSFNNKESQQTISKRKEIEFNPERFEDYHLQIMRSAFNSKTIKKQMTFHKSKGDQKLFFEFFEQKKSHMQFMNMKLREAGIPVMYYLANNKEEFKQAMELGANVVVTSRPAECELFKQMSLNRRAWRSGAMET